MLPAFDVKLKTDSWYLKQLSKLHNRNDHHCFHSREAGGLFKKGFKRTVKGMNVRSDGRIYLLLL